MSTLEPSPRTPGSLKHRLLSISELDLRARWLESELVGWGATLGARVLNELAEECEAARSDAREAMIAVALCFVRMSETQTLRELRCEAQASRLFSLERLLRRGEPNVDEDLQFRVPNYGGGRELSLGERRSLARRPDRRHFDRLLSDPHPMVASILLRNPRLTQDDVLRIVTRRPAIPSVILEVATNPRWIARGRIRHAILLNPTSPNETAMPLIGLCSRTELEELVSSGQLPLVRRATALELVERRPPHEAPERGALH